jgi:hypothetical protein
VYNPIWIILIKNFRTQRTSFDLEWKVFTGLEKSHFRCSLTKCGKRINLKKQNNQRNQDQNTLKVGFQLDKFF